MELETNFPNVVLNSKVEVEDLTVRQYPQNNSTANSVRPMRSVTKSKSLRPMNVVSSFGQKRSSNEVEDSQ